jgi:hypothetical protein
LGNNTGAEANPREVDLFFRSPRGIDLGKIKRWEREERGEEMKVKKKGLNLLEI